MAEVIFKLLRCDAEASHMLGWAKKEVRRLLDHVDTLNRTWNFGDVTVTARAYDGVARLWLAAAGTERMAVWAAINDAPERKTAAMRSYGWDAGVYRQAVSFSIWKDDGTMLYEKIWGDYTEANPAWAPNNMAAPIYISLGRLPYVVLPYALTTIGAQYPVVSGAEEMYEPFAFTLSGMRQYAMRRTYAPRPGALYNDFTTTMEPSTFVAVDYVPPTQYQLAGETIRLLSSVQTEYTPTISRRVRNTTASFVLGSEGEVIASYSGEAEVSEWIVDRSPLDMLYGYTATYSNVPYIGEYELVPLGSYAAYNPATGVIGASAGPIPELQPGQTLVFSGTLTNTSANNWNSPEGSFSWGVIPAYSEALQNERPVARPAWISQLQTGDIPYDVEKALRVYVPKSDYTYKMSELTATYISGASYPRTVRLRYTWTDGEGVEHVEEQILDGGSQYSEQISVIPLYDVDSGISAGYYSSRTVFTSYAMRFAGFGRIDSQESRGHIVRLNEWGVGNGETLVGAAAEEVVVVSGSIEGGVLDKFDPVHRIESYTTLASIRPDRVSSGDINSLSLDMSTFSTAVPTLTQQFQAAFHAGNNGTPLMPPGARAYGGFYMEPGMWVKVIPLQLVGKTATSYTYTVLYSATCTYKKDGGFGTSSFVPINRNVELPMSKVEETEALGSVRTLLIYGGIKWDDVKETARAQRKALNDPNDPAHDPLMKAVLDALKPPEPAP